MYLVLMALIILFWIIGIATGMVATLFLLDLEVVYLFNPAKLFIVKMKNQFAATTSRVLIFLQKGFRLYPPHKVEIPHEGTAVAKYL